MWVLRGGLNSVAEGACDAGQRRSIEHGGHGDDADRERRKDIGIPEPALAPDGERERDPREHPASGLPPFVRHTWRIIERASKIERVGSNGAGKSMSSARTSTAAAARVSAISFASRKWPQRSSERGFARSSAFASDQIEKRLHICALSWFCDA